MSLFSAPTIGDQVASASALTSTASADLVSAATNTNGILITSVSMSVADTGGAGSMELKVNAVTVLAVHSQPTTGTFGPTSSLGGFCAIRIPAGQAVSYTFTEASAGTGWVRISWRAA